MNQKVLNKVFVWGFLFLYLLVACISFCHAVQFFNIGNVEWMSITLAFAFELGLALSLAAILLSDSNKSNVLPWVLMIILCAVQVVGNVYSTYKYIAMSETEYYQYLAQPLLFWIEEVSEQSVRIIISWIIGAILPIIALFMTDMVASNLKNLDKDDKEIKSEETQEEPVYSAPAPEAPAEINDSKEEVIEDEEDLPEFETDSEKKESKFEGLKSMFKRANPTTLPPTTPAPTKAPETKKKEDPVFNRPSSLNKVKTKEVEATDSVHKADDPYFRSPEVVKQ